MTRDAGALVEPRGEGGSAGDGAPRPFRGNDYKKRVARYIVRAYGSRGVSVYDEVGVGTSIIGKQRRVDLLVLGPGNDRAMVVECKYQDSSGTADEKIPYALQDLAALPVPGVIAYAGSGFSEGVLHLLQSSDRAAYCMPPDDDRPTGRRAGESVDSGTWQLDHALALVFGWWDVLVAGKQPVRDTD